MRRVLDRRNASRPVSYISSLTWQLGPSGCVVTVEAEGVSKRETKKRAMGKVISQTH